MRNNASRGAALGRRHVPLLRRRLGQHRARRCAGLAQVVVRRADAAAAGGEEVAPDAIARDVLSRGREFGRHFRPVAIELLGHELRKAGHGALAHFRAGDADDDRVVRADHHPGIHLGRAVRRADHVRPAERKIEAEREPAAGGDRAHHKASAIDFRHEIHGCLLTHWLRHGWPPAPADRCRSGRYW